MKKLILSIVSIFFMFLAYSQVPEAFSYQAVVRDASGIVINNRLVSFRISILTGSSIGQEIYSETHSVTTNDFGLANLKIGMGENKTGIFGSNGWGLDKHFIKIEIDVNGGSSFALMGTSQLLSVPYAFHAQTVQNGDNWGTWTVQSDNTLIGNGTPSNLLGVNQSELIPKWVNIHDIPKGFADNIDNVNDADSDSTNEIQNISIDGNKLSLSKDGGTVNLPETASVWVKNGSKIYYINGNVGIGQENPEYLLDVNGRAHIDGITIGQGSGNHSGNTAVGYNAFVNNTTGSGNTAFGYNALYNNTTGIGNTAFGYSTLKANKEGKFNTSFGTYTLEVNTGSINTAIGQEALKSNTTGSNNSAIGAGALMYTISGNNNVALGYLAGKGVYGSNFEECTFIGTQSTPSVGRRNVTMLGYGITNAQCTGSNQVLLGNTSVSQIRAQVGSITTYSDARFKTNIKENVAGLDFIMKLKPVTFNKKTSELFKIWGEEDHSNSVKEVENIRYIGFLAQDVEKAANEVGFEFPGIDVPKNDKEVYTLRYNDFIMPMVKAMQEQQEMIKNQNQMIVELQKELELLKQQMASK